MNNYGVALLAPPVTGLLFHFGYKHDICVVCSFSYSINIYSAIDIWYRYSPYQLELYMQKHSIRYETSFSIQPIE